MKKSHLYTTEMKIYLVILIIYSEIIEINSYRFPEDALDAYERKIEKEGLKKFDTIPDLEDEVKSTLRVAKDPYRKVQLIERKLINRYYGEIRSAD